MANLFATVLSYAAPSSNYRGETEGNRTILQKLIINGERRAIISSESLRCRIRELLAERGNRSNRSRLDNEEQLAVKFEEFPNPAKYIDDLVFGFFIAKPTEGKGKDSEGKPKGSNLKKKGDSALRVNNAVALEPFAGDATFHQAPKHDWNNTSGLTHREESYTSFQFPFALRANDFGSKKEWLLEVVAAIAELSEVGGGHARAYYEMAARSVVVRVTERRASGYDLYGFKRDGSFPELTRLLRESEDLPGEEFLVGGELVRSLSSELRERLNSSGVTLMNNAEQALRVGAERAIKE
jgi:CRISPR-associated protein Cst2